MGLYRVDDKIYAIHDICTHEHAHLSEGVQEGCVVECPLHLARFDLRTGEPIDGPAYTPVATYETKVANDTVFVRLPEST